MTDDASPGSPSVRSRSGCAGAGRSLPSSATRKNSMSPRNRRRSKSVATPLVWPCRNEMTLKSWPRSGSTGRPSKMALTTDATSLWPRMPAAPPVAKAPPPWPASATWLSASSNCRSSESAPRLTRFAPGANSKRFRRSGRFSIGKHQTKSLFFGAAADRSITPQPRTRTPYLPRECRAPKNGYSTNGTPTSGQGDSRAAMA